MLKSGLNYTVSELSELYPISISWWTTTKKWENEKNPTPFSHSFLSLPPRITFSFCLGGVILLLLLLPPSPTRLCCDEAMRGVRARLNHLRPTGAKAYASLYARTVRTKHILAQAAFAFVGSFARAKSSDSRVFASRVPSNDNSERDGGLVLWSQGRPISIRLWGVSVRICVAWLFFPSFFSGGLLSATLTRELIDRAAVVCHRNGTEPAWTDGVVQGLFLFAARGVRGENKG